MSQVIGQAAILIVSEAAGFAKGLGNELDQAADKGSSKFNTVFGGALKVGGAAAGASLALVLGSALHSGFGRLVAIDNAEGKLRGLGFTADEVKGVMDNALASVKGTAFGLGDAATLAAQMIGSGIKPGDELTRVLKTMADTATIAGVPLAEMSDLFGDMAASGKVSGDEIGRFASRGVPALQYIADHFKITQEEAAAMVRGGKISFLEFQGIMEESLGGAALESGNTFQGAMENSQAALGRLGAAMLDPMFEQLAPVLGNVIEKLDSLAPYAKIAGETIGKAFKWFVENVLPKLADGLEWIIQTVPKVVDAFKNLADWIKRNETPLKIVATAILVVLIPAFVALAVAAVATAASVVASWVAQSVATVVNVVKAVAYMVIMGAQYLIVAAQAVAMGIATAAAWLMAIWPIALVIAAVIAVVAIFVILWKKSEAFRNFWKGLWNAIVGVFNWVWQMLQVAWDAILAAFQKVWEYIVAFGGFWASVWATIVSVFMKVWEVIKFVIALIIALFLWWIDTITKPIRAFFDWIWPYIKGVFDTVKDVIKAAIDWILDKWEALSELVTKVVEWFQGIWDAISNWFTNIKDAIKNWLLEKIMRPIEEFRKKIVDGVKNWLKGIWDAFSTWFSGLKDQIKQWLLDHIMRPIDDFRKSVVDAGKNFIQGLWDGIKEKGQWLKDKLMQFIKDHVPGPILDVLGIASPSKVAMEMGRQVAKGLAIGIEDGAGMVSGASRALAVEAIPPYGSAAGSGSGSGPVAYNIELHVSMDDLAQLSTLDEFLGMLQSARIDDRRTRRSGAVTV